jgi:hypothetical protein
VVFQTGVQSGNGLVTVTYTIPTVTVTVVASGSQSYGSSSPAFSTSTTAPAGDSFTGTLTCTTVGSPATTISAGLPAGSYSINSSSCSGLGLSGPTASDYRLVYSGATFTVNPVALTVKAPSTSVVYGDPVATTFTPTYAGFVNGDSAASLTTQPTCTTTAVAGSPAGTYPITCTGAVDPNYTITYSPGTLTITKAPTKLSAPALSLGVIAAKLTRSDTGAAIAGETITFTSSKTTLCSGVTNNSGVATCSMSPADNLLALASGYQASFAGDTNYLPSSATAGP